MRKLNVYKHYTQAVNLARIALRVNVVFTKKNLMISRKTEAKKNVKKEINQCARCVVVIGKLLDNISDNNHIKIIICYYNVFFFNWYLVLFPSFYTLSKLCIIQIEYLIKKLLLITAYLAKWQFPKTYIGKLKT